MQINMVFALSDHIIQQNFDQNLRNRAVATGRNLVEVQSVDRRNKAAPAGKHLHTDNRDGDDRTFQISRSHLDYEPKYSLNRSVFGGVHSGREAKRGSRFASVNDDYRHSDRASNCLANLNKTLCDLPRLGRDVANLDYSIRHKTIDSPSP